MSGPEEAILHWSGKIQAACKALNSVVPPRKMDALRLNLVEFSSQLATLNIHYYLTLCYITETVLTKILMWFI